jgi:hypothetical protein
MRHQHATDRHRRRPEKKAPGSYEHSRPSHPEFLCRQIKEQVKDPEPEEGNVAQTIEPSAVAPIAAQPIFAVKLQA